MSLYSKIPLLSLPQIVLELSRSEVFTRSEVDEAVELVCKVGANALEVERMGLWTIDDHDSLQSQKIYNLSKDSFTSGETISHSEMRYYLSSIYKGITVSANDTSTDPHTRPFYQSHCQPKNISSMVDSSILYMGKIIGVLSAEHVGDKRQWTSDQVSFVGLLANLITNAYANTARRKIDGEIINLNLSLEEKIIKRTRELETSNKELKETLALLHKAQAQLVHSEKLAALGQLISGIAHEVNNPISSIKATVETLLLPTVQAHENRSLFQEFPLTFSESEKQMAEKFFKSILNHNLMVFGKDRRKIKNMLKDYLESFSVHNAHSLADNFSDYGIDDLSPIEPILKNPNAHLLLNGMISRIRIEKGLMAVLNSTERVSKIIYALKNYSRIQPSTTKSPVSLLESIQTVIQIFKNQIKDKVEVVLDLSSVPLIQGFPEDLIQLWTNLIHNALQAMDNKGVLECKAQTTPLNTVQVSIIDSGSGIPAELKEKIFKPFFTTKKMGEGSGLGLDIVKKIAEKHGGFVTVESKPGRTCFLVELPID